MSADAKPILSVVIPTLGRPILVQTLESLTRARGFSDIEVVVAGAIPDATVLGRLNELIAKHPQIRHLRPPLIRRQMRPLFFKAVLLLSLHLSTKGNFHDYHGCIKESRPERG